MKQIPPINLPNITAHKVLQVVAENYELPESYIISHKKHGSIPDARHTTMRLLRSIMKYREIASFFGMTIDSVTRGIKACKNKYETDTNFQNRFDYCHEKLNEMN